MPDQPDPKDPDDRKVKDVLDSATRADLERWFGLPSFEVAQERAEAVAEERPETAERRKRQENAMAAIDPALVEAIHGRNAPDRLYEPLAPLELRIDPSIAQLDEAMIEQRYTIAEPREVQLPPQLYDDLKQCVPQALLRDLHRSERHYDKLFERVDTLQDYRVDVRATTSELMGTSMKAVIERLPMTDALDLLRQLRAERKKPWTEVELPNRRGSR